MAERQQLVEIVHKLQSGEEGAAAALYESFYSELHYYILKRVNDPETAETLTQETFIEIFDTIYSLSEPEQFGEWSRQIADQVCGSYKTMRRKMLLGKVGTKAVDSISEGRKELISSEEDKIDDNPSVHEMIDSLPEEQRIEVLKKYVAGKKKGNKAGIKVMESVARKLIVGVLTTLILAMINQIGILEPAVDEQMTVEESGNHDQNATADQNTEIEETATTLAESTDGLETSLTTGGGTESSEIQVLETESVPMGEDETMPPEQLEYEIEIDCGVKGIGTCTDTEIVIPDKFDHLPVTYVCTGAFMGCNTLTSIKLPYSIQVIRRYAFADCSSLVSMDIPDMVCLIGDNAFNGCNNLTRVTLPKGMTFIDDFVFYNCNRLTDVTIPETIVSIGESAFGMCSWLPSINIPAGVTEIQPNAFYRCIELKQIHVDERNLIYYSVNNCLITRTSKKLVLCGSDSVIPTDGSITSIGDYACSNCREWSEVVIPEGVTSIGAYAFELVPLVTVTIPMSVTSIGEYAFYGGGALKTINYAGTISQWNAIEKGRSWDWGIMDYTVYCTDGQIS